MNEERLKELCDKYLERYGKRLKLAEQGVPGINKKDIIYYLSLWKEVKAKSYDFEMLTSEAKDEVVASVADDYNCNNDCDDCILNETEEDNYDLEDLKRDLKKGGFDLSGYEDEEDAEEEQ